MSHQTVQDLPKFSKINENDIKNNIEKSIIHCVRLREKLLKEHPLTWKKFISPMEEAEDSLNKNFSILGHLNSVKNTKDLRAIFNDCTKKISEYLAESQQDKRMLKAYEFILNNDKSLDRIQIKIIHDAICKFELSGVRLIGDNRLEFKKNAIKLSRLQNDFESNVLDSTYSWSYHTLNEEDLSGLSKNIKYQAHLKAFHQKKDGFILGLDDPTYLAIMQQSNNRLLREIFYRAYVTRASDNAKDKRFDNSNIIQEIVQLRRKQALLLGFKNYSEVSLLTKMAASSDEVLNFMNKLLKKIRPYAEEELKKLTTFSKGLDLNDSIKPWDVLYYSNKAKKEQYGFTNEDLRVYFPLERVMRGLFTIILSLYGITVKTIERWDRYEPRIELYEFYDTNKELRGTILVDLFAREDKTGGAWMNPYLNRYKRLDGSIQRPIAYVVCNFMPPRKGTPPLLTHSDVVTLFHEFGHALHHILTKCNYLSVSGINSVEWDAVEFPSQFMENFCWHQEVITLLSEHFETKKSIPLDLLQKLASSRYYQIGLSTLRQIELAIFDIQLYQTCEEDINAHEVISNIRKSTSLLAIPTFNRFENSFLHIFAGGYAAGYYSYKWSEVLSSDAFAEFEKQGNKDTGSILDKSLGKRFMNTILEKGGSAPAIKLFEEFKGRKPSIQSWLNEIRVNHKNKCVL